MSQRRLRTGPAALLLLWAVALQGCGGAHQGFMEEVDAHLGVLESYPLSAKYADSARAHLLDYSIRASGRDYEKIHTELLAKSKPKLTELELKRELEEVAADNEAIYISKRNWEDPDRGPLVLLAKVITLDEGKDSPNITAAQTQVVQGLYSKAVTDFLKAKELARLSVSTDITVRTIEAGSSALGSLLSEESTPVDSNTKDERPKDDDERRSAATAPAPSGTDGVRETPAAAQPPPKTQTVIVEEAENVLIAVAQAQAEIERCTAEFKDRVQKLRSIAEDYDLEIDFSLPVEVLNVL